MTRETLKDPANASLTSALVGPLIRRACKGFGMDKSDLKGMVSYLKEHNLNTLEEFAGGHLDLYQGDAYGVMLEATALRYVLWRLERQGVPENDRWQEKEERERMERAEAEGRVYDIDAANAEEEVDEDDED